MRDGGGGASLDGNPSPLRRPEPDARPNAARDQRRILWPRSPHHLMTVRSEALRWLARRRVTGGHVVTSKRYSPDESWTKEKAWWVQVPLSAIQQGKPIDIVCQVEPGQTDFYHLRVPAAFFVEHSKAFATIGEDKINLFLAAEPGIEFVDQRGSGRISFARFKQD